MLEVSGELLDREGADAVTMRRVAGAVGITAMAVYRHFPNREGLLSAVADAGFAELRERLLAVRRNLMPERLTEILDVYLDYALEKPRLFELMFLTLRPGARQFPGDFRAGASPTANVAAGLIEEGMRSGVFREDDVWEITLEMGALLQGMVMLYLGGRIGMEAGEFRALCHRSFGRYFDGIRA
ncbi:MAG: TetR/AcrR family transcriptional regulator [Acidobacteriaceae bacterium]